MHGSCLTYGNYIEPRFTSNHIPNMISNQPRFSSTGGPSWNLHPLLGGGVDHEPMIMMQVVMYCSNVMGGLE